MQQRHGSTVLAMEQRLPCIKPPKLYVNSSRVWEHILIRWGYQSEAEQGKQDYFSFLGAAALSEAIQPAMVDGCTRGCHTSDDKHTRNQEPRSSYHNLQLQ